MRSCTTAVGSGGRGAGSVRPGRQPWAVGIDSAGKMCWRGGDAMAWVAPLMKGVMGVRQLGEAKVQGG